MQSTIFTPTVDDQDAGPAGRFRRTGSYPQHDRRRNVADDLPRTGMKVLSSIWRSAPEPQCVRAARARANRQKAIGRHYSAQINRETFRQPPRRLNYRVADPRRAPHESLQGHPVMPTKRQTLTFQRTMLTNCRRGSHYRRVRAGGLMAFTLESGGILPSGCCWDTSRSKDNRRDSNCAPRTSVGGSCTQLPANSAGVRSSCGSRCSDLGFRSDVTITQRSC